MTMMQKVLEEKLLRGDGDLYGIYRLREDENGFRFYNLNQFQEKGTVPHWEQYASVYIGELRPDTELEDLWNTFHVGHPDDYFSIPLSVGDVVVLRRGTDASAHFVDSFGFTELPDFFPEQPTEKLTHSLVRCLTCGKEQAYTGSEPYCSRCSALIGLLGCGLTLDNLASSFWEGCFGCGADIIAKIDLTGDSLTIQCDNCGETHEIPFAAEDIIRYIRSGIVRELVED